MGARTVVGAYVGTHKGCPYGGRPGGGKCQRHQRYSGRATIGLGRFDCLCFLYQFIFTHIT